MVLTAVLLLSSIVSSCVNLEGDLTTKKCEVEPCFKDSQEGSSMCIYHQRIARCGRCNYQDCAIPADEKGFYCIYHRSSECVDVTLRRIYELLCTMRGHKRKRRDSSLFTTRRLNGY